MGRTLILSDYERMFDYVFFNSDDIKKTIKNYELTFLNIRNEKVEWGMYLPPFIYSFYHSLFVYNHIKKTNKIPTQKEFSFNYFIINDDFFHDNNVQDNEREAIQARLFRTYPSLIRDFHFAFLVKESLPNAIVHYNTTLDYKEGIDLSILYQNKLYVINLFTNTSRSNEARLIKTTRHMGFDNVHYIELPIMLSDENMVGVFYLYNDNHINQLKNIIHYL